jgi:hypothetical protein
VRVVRPFASLILLAGLALPGTAQAQARIATRTAPVVGNAPNVCVLQQPRLAQGAQNNFRGLNGNTLQIDTLVDPSTLATRGASAELRFNAVCNFPHRLRVEAQNNGLWRTGSTVLPPQGFAYAIPYQALLSWGAGTILLNADAQIRRIHEERITVDQPTAGEVQLRVEIQPGASNVQSNAPVIAGNYGDLLRVTLEPQQ